MVSDGLDSDRREVASTATRVFGQKIHRGFRVILALQLFNFIW